MVAVEKMSYIMLHYESSTSLEKVISSDGWRSLFMLKVIGSRISFYGASDVWSWIRHSSCGGSASVFIQKLQATFEGQENGQNWLLRKEMKNMENKFIKRSRKKSRVQPSWLKSSSRDGKVGVRPSQLSDSEDPGTKGFRDLAHELVVCQDLGHGFLEGFNRGELKDQL